MLHSAKILTVQSLDAVLAALRRGQVIAIPTDTVYGLACLPDNAEAVAEIHAIKRRPPGLELTLLGADSRDFAELVVVSEPARRLMARFWPGPLSLVLPCGRQRLAVPRQGATLSVRVPQHPLLRDLLKLSGPLATTSANRHGEPAANSAAEVVAALGTDVAAVLDGGRGGGLASTIIDCSVEPPRLIREGPISAEELAPYFDVPQGGTWHGQSPR